MPGTDETLSLFTRKIEELESQKTRLEGQINVLKAAYEAFSTTTQDARPRGIRAPRKRGVRQPRPPARRKVDKQAREHTIAFMTARGDSPTTPDDVAQKFGIKYSAANQRLHMLEKEGAAQRVAPGKFVLIGNPDAMRTEVSRSEGVA